MGKNLSDDDEAYEAGDLDFEADEALEDESEVSGKHELDASRYRTSERRSDARRSIEELMELRKLRQQIGDDFDPDELSR